MVSCTSYPHIMQHTGIPRYRQVVLSLFAGKTLQWYDGRVEE